MIAKDGLALAGRRSGVLPQILRTQDERAP
jgi:hypothetical protein